MGQLETSHMDVVPNACRVGAGEAAVALSELLGVPISLAVGTPSKLQLSALPETLTGPGLAIVLTIGGAGVLVLLADSSRLVPPWCAQPDTAGQKKLNVLAQRLGIALFPEMAIPKECRSAHVSQLAEVIRSGELPTPFSALSIQCSASNVPPGTVWVVWPATRREAILQPEPSVGSAGSASHPTMHPSSPRPTPACSQRPATEEDLPPYARSLLRIQIPVVVTLARHRQPLAQIVELGPGSIIHFNKSCEEMLDLEVGGRRIASGEAVKVGDKFGLRLTSILLPGERFKPVRR